VNRCLEKSRDDRYPDMTAVRRDLAAVQRRLADLDEDSAAADADIGASRASRQVLDRLQADQLRSHLDAAREALRDADFAAALAASEHALLLSGDSAEALEYEQRARAGLERDDRPSQPAAAADFGATLIAFPPPHPAVAPSPLAVEPAADATLIFDGPPKPAAATAEFPVVQLVVTRSSDPRFVGRSVRVDKPTFSLGRADDCDLRLSDHTWSRKHAEIAYVNDGFLIRDFGSRNGIYVNGRRLREGPLPFGAIVTVGETDFTFSHVHDTTLPDLTGCEVTARYKLVKLLRESAKGAMYVATDLRTSGDVAIKLLSPELLRYPGYRDKFQRDAEIAVRLRHPHICGVIDYGVTTLERAGAPAIRTQFLCFELMSGGSLTDRIEADTPCPPPRVSEWLTAISRALDFAHRQNVLHGDLKPNAIVFDEDDNPYLTDFSIAQQTLNAEGRPTTGTPAYMAPELWDDGAITPASEQFALAAIVYYLVTGSRPFEGQEHPDVRRRNFRRGPIPAHEEAAHNGRASLPRAVSQVLARALATSADQRYDSLTTFANAFKVALRHTVHRSEEPEVFISYQRDVSAPLAMYLADKLKTQGIRPFVDAEGLDSAGPFPAHLERAIEDTDVFVCLLAGTTLQSAWVREEIRFAHRYEKPMIPVMQESYDRRSANDGDPAVEALLACQACRSSTGATCISNTPPPTSFAWSGARSLNASAPDASLRSNVPSLKRVGEFPEPEGAAASTCGKSYYRLTGCVRS
jgi:serine/threonine protein kinase